LNRTFIVKKILFALLTVFAVLAIDYFLFRVMPGNPVAMLVRNANLTQEGAQKVIHKYGLDQSVFTQFVIYLGDVFTGDMGTSFNYKKPVWDVILTRLPATLILTIPAEIIAILLGCYIGVIAAKRRGKRADVLGTGLSMVFYAMPTFWLGILLIALFSVTLGWFPTSGMRSVIFGQITWQEDFADVMRHLFLPALTLSLVMLGNYTLVMRNSLTEVLTEDYINTAYAKGMTPRQVLRRHAIPNAMIPVTTLITMNLAFTISGALQVETVFSWPGIGRLMYDALQGRDYPLLQGIFLLISICVIGANLLSDLLYYFMDPRVKG